MGNTRPKSAKTVCLLSVISIVQVSRPEQSPDQPANSEPEAGVAVRSTLVPRAKDAKQASPQLIPAGELTTVPVPKPLFITERRSAVVLKMAVTELSKFIVIVQVPVPEQLPRVHPANSEPEAGVAVKVTVVP